MKIMIWSLALIVALAALWIVWVRVAGDDPGVWHVDPLTAKRGSRPNSYIVRPGGVGSNPNTVAPTYGVAPGVLGDRLIAGAMAEPGTTLLAGSAADGWFTLVQRSNLMRFPDYVSVRVIPAEGGSTIAIFSRSRYGYSDRGVNKARIRRWLKLLQPMQQ